MIRFFAAFFLAGSATTETQPVAPQPSKTPSIRYSDCRCPDQDETAFIILEGLVVDAEVTLSTDGLSPADRQAMIFNVTSSSADVKGRTKIWHATKPSQCGVVFDYGKKYSIAVRKIELGFETDECLMRRMRTFE